MGWTRNGRKREGERREGEAIVGGRDEETNPIPKWFLKLP